MGKTRGFKGRKGLAKAKKVVRRDNARKTKQQLDTHTLKVKMTAVLIPTQGTTVSNFINQFYPLCSGTATTDWTKSADYTTLKYQYDQVRVNRLRVIITPKANVLDAANAQADSSYTLTGDGMIHTAIDRDSATPANISAMSRYGSYRRYSLLKKFSRTYGIKWPKGVWLDCGSEYGNTQLLTQIGAFGGIGLYAENLLEDYGEIWNEPYAEVTFLYDIVFRGKITPNTAIDNSGNVVLFTPTSSVSLPQSTLIVTGGALNGANYRLEKDVTTGAIVGVPLDESHAP